LRAWWRQSIVDALLAPVNAPALIIAGRRDTSVGYRDAWLIIENYPRATFPVLDRTDHGWPIDRTELFQSLVSKFDRRLAGQN
jgi:hypothetical protein